MPSRIRTKDCLEEGRKERREERQFVTSDRLMSEFMTALSSGRGTARRLQFADRVQLAMSSCEGEELLS